MNIISNKCFSNERALYGASNIHLKHCMFDGVEDGESALKEATNIKLDDCFMNLRYPFWHDDTVSLTNVIMTDKCRAALWYTSNITIDKSKLGGIKALRECDKIKISDSEIISQEFGWKSHEIDISNSTISSEYPLFMSKDIHFSNVTLNGKYSFQYVENMTLENCILNTKDAFWHSKNVTVKDSVVKGEYLAWYSDGLTLINCKIIGTQPLCYCTRLTLIDCETEEADLAFEYSDVEASIIGEIISVKNVRSGSITCDKIGSIIHTSDSKYECTCNINISESNSRTAK